MLAQYCRHVVAARRIAQLVTAAEKARKMDIDDYDKLLKMQDREGRALSSLATRMRLTHQATVAKDVAHKPGVVDSPWEYSGEDE
jgi:hypothetical protein